MKSLSDHYYLPLTSSFYFLTFLPYSSYTPAYCFSNLSSTACCSSVLTYSPWDSSFILPSSWLIRLSSSLCYCYSLSLPSPSFFNSFIFFCLCLCSSFFFCLCRLFFSVTCCACFIFSSLSFINSSLLLSYLSACYCLHFKYLSFSLCLL